MRIGFDITEVVMDYEYLRRDLSCIRLRTKSLDHENFFTLSQAVLGGYQLPVVFTTYHSAENGLYYINTITHTQGECDFPNPRSVIIEGVAEKVSFDPLYSGAFDRILTMAEAYAWFTKKYELPSTPVKRNILSPRARKLDL
jgi:hypothetical protein